MKNLILILLLASVSSFAQTNVNNEDAHNVTDYDNLLNNPERTSVLSDAFTHLPNIPHDSKHLEKRNQVSAQYNPPQLIRCFSYDEFHKEYVKCSCENGQREVRKACSVCNGWSIEYRRRNTCPKCFNQGISGGYETCSRCGGSGNVVDKELTIKEALKNQQEGVVYVYFPSELILFNQPKIQKIGNTNYIKTDWDNIINRFGNFYKIQLKNEINNLGYYEQKKNVNRIGVNKAEFSLNHSDINYIINQLFPGFELADMAHIENFILECEISNFDLASRFVVFDPTKILSPDVYPFINTDQFGLGVPIGEKRYKLRQYGLNYFISKYNPFSVYGCSDPMWYNIILTEIPK